MNERAYIDGARAGAGLARLRATTARLMDGFARAGAIEVEPAALQPADLLLDLYGEDIRARAYVTRDGWGEQMLRPDFTVPVVRRHMAEGAEPARYCYCGPVWRRQGPGTARASEYLQAGFEVFDGRDTAAADAEVFALIAELLAAAPLTVATGDMGLVLAAIDGLDTSPHRRAALRRHVWRPERFHRLLDRFSGARPGKEALIAAAREGRAETLIRAAGKPVGLRSRREILDRIARLLDDADTPPLAGAQVDLIETLLALRGSIASALSALRDLRREAPALGAAVDRFARRVEALALRGVDPDTLPFEGSFGRTTLEYYDGFVFGFIAPDRPDLPVIASGGRYDALTRVLGGGAGIPAVGAMIRPEALLALETSPC